MSEEQKKEVVEKRAQKVELEEPKYKLRVSCENKRDKVRWIELSVLILTAVAVSVAAIQAWRSANIAAETVNIMSATTREAARSADSAAESIKIMNAAAYEAARSADSAEKSTEIMLMETRPYLHVSCDHEAKGCNKQTGITTHTKGECIETVSFDINNNGILPGKIDSAEYKFAFYSTDEQPIVFSAKHDSSNEQAFVFPNKPLAKNITKMTIDGMEYIPCNIKEIDFEFHMYYSSPMDKETTSHFYEISLKTYMKDKRASIVYERMK